MRVVFAPDSTPQERLDLAIVMSCLYMAELEAHCTLLQRELHGDSAPATVWDRLYACERN